MWGPNEVIYLVKVQKIIMSVQFKIKITKAILQSSKECGTNSQIEMIGKNCAIAVSLMDIFPEVFVSGDYIYPFGFNENNHFEDLKIQLPKVASDFIRVFDSLCAIPNVRLILPEFEFELSIPDEIISRIDIDEIRRLTSAPRLQLSSQRTAQLRCPC